ncbi:MAG: YifB family Mg chelatase-like AAA ATPase [Planctomycetota bacterium]
MLAQVHSFVLQGIEPLACEVEVDVSESGLPKTTIVGLPDAAVKESLERVRSAIVNSGYPFPMARLLVSLAPGDVRKEGPIYDLPIAVGLLLAGGIVTGNAHKRLLVAGELALDGRVRPIAGVINLTLLAKRMGMDGVVVPSENAGEASAVEGIDVYAAGSLATVVGFLNGVLELEPMPPSEYEAGRGDGTGLVGGAIDFADIRGQEGVKRALMVAAAGGHNVIMVGPAGTGKSMCAKALPGILPPLSRDEALEVTRVYSAVGKAPRGQPLITARPVRAPHHTASPVAVVGGGGVPRPGEVSLAHHGVLFLDEMPEFPRAVLETLRQPLEDGEVSIARASGSVRFPASFMLVGAMNPTPKGDMPADEVGHKAMERYLSKLSGPLIDRVDIHVEVPPVPYEQLRGRASGTGSAELRERVVKARAVQAARNGGSLKTNAGLSGRELDRWAELDAAAASLLKSAMQELRLSARAYDKVRRVARTLADLEGSGAITVEQVAEAVGYRLLDRQM